MKALHLAVIVAVLFVITITSPTLGQKGSTAQKASCPVHITTRLHDPSYVRRAVEIARESPEFTRDTNNENFTYYAIYGTGQYDQDHCNNFFWLQTGVVFSNGNGSSPSYLLGFEDPELSGGVIFANCDDCPKAEYNDSFTPSLTKDQFIINNHHTRFGADYPPRLDAPPLKQTEAGVFPRNVECGYGLHLLTRDGGAFCVKQSSMPRLVSMGWQDVKTYDTQHNFAWCQNYTSYISDKKVILSCGGAPSGPFNLPPPTYVMKHCPGPYGCLNSFWYEEVIPQTLLSEPQKERVVNMTLANFGLASNAGWSLDRFLPFASGNQWFADVQIFVSNGTANCGRYVQSEINLQNFEVLSSFSTDPAFSLCKTASLQSGGIRGMEPANPLGITALVVYHPFLGCLSPNCTPNNFYLKINSNSSSYLFGYDICDGQSCARNGTLSVPLPLNSPLKPEYAHVELPQYLKWHDGDAVHLKVMVSSLPDNRTAAPLDLGNSTIVS